MAHEVTDMAQGGAEEGRRQQVELAESYMITWATADLRALQRRLTQAKRLEWRD